jgi:hypothetical protein
VPDSYLVLFERGLAQHLDDLALGLYKPSAVYTTAEATVERPAIVSGPDLPTTLDNVIALTTLDPIREGRANFTHRIQILSRLKGTKVQSRNLAWNLAAALDHKQGIPAGFNVSWVSLFSQLTFTKDSNGRYSTAQTFYLKGRRPVVGG